MNFSMILGVLDPIVQGIINFIYGLLYWVLKSLKGIFDFCYVLVRKVAGIDTYYYQGTLIDPSKPGNQTVSGDIIEIILRTDIIRNLFITLLVLGTVLLFIVTFVAIWKTEWEFGKDQNSKSKVINAALKALFNFIAVPVITFFGIFVGNALLKAIDGATKGGKDILISDMVFTSIATNALRADHTDSTSNYEFIIANQKTQASADGSATKKGLYLLFSDSSGDINTVDILDAFKNNYKLTSKGVYYADGNGMIDVKGINDKLNEGTLVFSFDDEQLVNYFFDTSKFNYVVGFLVLIIMVKTMLTIIYGLVKRLFMMLFLFLVSPPIVAISPLNEKALTKWREVFIKNAGSAFVTLGIYNLFLSVYPLFARIQLFDSKTALLGLLGGTLNEFVSLLIVCVGLLTINELTKIISDLFGLHDVYNESTDKGKSLWGNAFGLAGKALKPATAPLALAGGAAKFGANWHYKGLGNAVKELGSGIKKGATKTAGKITNAGPLGDMWKSMGMNKEGALKGLGDAKSQIFSDDAKEARQITRDTRQAIKESQKQASKTLGKRHFSAKDVDAMQNDEKLQKYNQNKAIAEAYYAKKQQDKNYKATAEELKAIRSYNANKNFGLAAKKDAKNKLIEAKAQQETLDFNAAARLVKAKNKVKLKAEEQGKLNATQNTISKVKAERDAEKKIVEEQAKKVDAIMSESASKTKAETKAQLEDVQKDLDKLTKNFSSGSGAKDLDRRMEKLINLLEENNKKNSKNNKK